VSLLRKTAQTGIAGVSWCLRGLDALVPFYRRAEPRAMFVVRRAAEAALASAAGETGALDAWLALSERLRGGAATILTYHRILPRDEAAAEPDPGIVTTAETFEAEMRFIARHCSPLPLQEAAERLDRGSRLPRRAVVVTFDDGWRDNYVHAYPVLRRLAIPATVFAATGYVGTSRPLWTREAARGLAEAARRGRWGGVEEAFFAQGMPCAPDPGGNRVLLKAAISGLKRLPAERRERIVSDLVLALGLDAVPDAWVTWDELREMADAGIEVGSHTRTHAILTAESAERVRDEVEGSRRDIERHLGRSPVAFCYPDGACVPAIEAAVQRAGYALACSTRRGVAGFGADRYLLPRIGAEEAMAAGPSGAFCQALFSWRLAGGLERLCGATCRPRARARAPARADAQCASSGES